MRLPEIARQGDRPKECFVAGDVLAPVDAPQRAALCSGEESSHVGSGGDRRERRQSDDYEDDSLHGSNIDAVAFVLDGRAEAYCLSAVLMITSGP